MARSLRSHPRHLVGKSTAHKKDAIQNITIDNKVNSYFPYSWSPASLTINIYFYLFLYLYITRITINNDTPHLKSPKNQNRVRSSTYSPVAACVFLIGVLHHGVSRTEFSLTEPIPLQAVYVDHSRNPR